MNPLNMLNNAEQAHLISILVLEADWVWELPDGSYIKLCSLKEKENKHDTL